MAQLYYEAQTLQAPSLKERPIPFLDAVRQSLMLYIKTIAHLNPVCWKSGVARDDTLFAKEGRATARLLGASVDRIGRAATATCRIDLFVTSTLETEEFVEILVLVFRPG
jgi:hypothetical protein